MREMPQRLASPDSCAAAPVDPCAVSPKRLAPVLSQFAERVGLVADQDSESTADERESRPVRAGRTEEQKRSSAPLVGGTNELTINVRDKGDRMETEGEDMQKVLHQRVTVLPGGKVEVVDPELEAGEQVDVVVSPVQSRAARSAWRVISEASGHRLFGDAKQVDDYLAEERSWER